MSASWPVIVLGGSGYVAGEFLRLVAQHPRLELGAAVSTSQVGEPISGCFAHLSPVYGDSQFKSLGDIIEGLAEAPHWAVLSAAPHGASAEIISRLLDRAAEEGVGMTVVDASADFRFTDADVFAGIYGQAHASPQHLPEFRCAVPEHLHDVDTPHAAHPGCFATAMLLAIVPLIEQGICAESICVSAVTGSTGAGRTARDSTHHPVRQSNLFAYQVLKHRHDPEVRELTRVATGKDIRLHFVPHSGPFARGIHATIFATLNGEHSADEINTSLAQYYRDDEFVRVVAAPPRIKDVAASNYALLNASVDGDTVVVCSVLDNLLKGAAGGSIQWMNRLLGLPETLGLTTPSPGWL